jgi:tetratricopeptide (TPR) repeat protein
MPTLTIRELQRTTAGFDARLIIDNHTQYDIAIHDPFEGKQERELEFYFERWIRFPFDNQVIAQRAADSVKAYGHDLFDQVFRQNLDAYSDYKQACRGGLTSLQIEIEGSPDFQALHWEALKDPQQPRLFAVEGVFTRRRFQKPTVSIDLKPSPVINLLVVTARPDEESDVGYRTISRPLIEAIQRSQLRVNVKLLRPGTFQALSDHLEGREGYYHIVHFDAHGGLLTYDQFQEGVKQNRYLYQARYGRWDMKRYEGVKAFLFLEGESKGKADPVEAQELAEVLTNKGIPICILNACQSGKQVRSPHSDDPVRAVREPPLPDDAETNNPTRANRHSPLLDDVRETSLGSRLMAAGVQMVVAMGYSVTVTAAALMMETLYGQLFARQGIPEAIRLGRKALYNQKNRRVYFNQMVELEDWLLPVVYANREVDLKLREFEPREKAEYLMQRSQRYRFEPPTYGFVGRDLEILKIEKALLRHNILLLRGMGGTGKTTLLNYLRDWWQTTHFIREVFYFGYDKAAHTVQHILRVIGKALYPDPYEFAVFEAMPFAAQMEDLADKLCAQPYALMLDNLESVTGQALAIPNTLPQAEQEQLRSFLQRLRGGKTRVILGSRSGEGWLADAFTLDGKVNLYALAGLDPESRTQLAEKILDAQVKDANRIAQLRTDDSFKRLMKLLAGYPLAMEVVLANLARQSPQEILDGLNAADVDLNVGGEDKTNNILKCVEYSHSNLSPDAQKLLVCLAPFNNFIFQELLPQYFERIPQMAFTVGAKHSEEGLSVQADAFGGNTSPLRQAIQEAINWGLLSEINLDELPPSFPKKAGEKLLTIQLIFPYFLRTKLNNLDPAIRAALDNAFQAHYQTLANVYQQWLESNEPHEQQLGLFFCRLEYENLYSALKLCLEKQESVGIFFCLFKFLSRNQDFQSAIKLSEFICKTQETYPSDIRRGKIGLEIVMALSALASCYIPTKNYQNARTICEKILEITPQLHEISENQKQSMLAKTHHDLGIIAQDLWEYEQARSHYQQALDIYIEYGESTVGDSSISRYSQASTYVQLGNVSYLLREYEQARSHYQQALDIYIEYGDRHEQANAYHGLGIVAQDVRQYEQAQTYYQQALDCYIEYNDRYQQAKVYHQLGKVAEEVGEYERARSHYHKALDIKIEFGDRYRQALTYVQLGNVAYRLQEYEQARSHYHQALEIFVEYGDRYNEAITRHQLGNVAHEMQEYEQARSHFLQTLDIRIEFDDRHGQASTHHQLGLLAKAQKDYQQAQQHLLQALSIFVEFGDEYYTVMTLRNLARLPQATQSDKLLPDLAQILNETVEAVRRGFEAQGGL